jgi:GTPase SAR1 family protein
MNLNKWMKEIEKVIGCPPSVLVGNKLDLVKNDDERPIPKTEGDKIKANLGCSYYLETSAKEDVRIDKAFLKLSEIMLKKNKPFD